MKKFYGLIAFLLFALTCSGREVPHLRMIDATGGAPLEVFIMAAIELSSQKKMDISMRRDVPSKALAMLVWQGEQDPASAMERLNLAQNSNPHDIETWITQVFQAHPDMLESYRKGKTNVVKAITGAVMAASKGKADPVMLKTLLEKRLMSL